MSNKTTTQLNSCTPKTCSCTDLWSISQKFCLQRLSSPTDNNTYSYIKNKKVRARRITGTYARLYLEIERDGTRKIGDPSKKGRFYWMALGAFASKTVACTLEHWTLNRISKNVNWAVSAEDWFGQGNFWLFQDIAGWHHYYSCYGSAVFFKCINDRNTNNLVPQMKTAINQAPWAAKSLPKINNLKSNSFLIKGFEYVKVFENSSNGIKKKNAQYDNLLQTAYHEQKMILQPLIYEDKKHQVEIKAMKLAGPLAPHVQLVFSSSCSIPQVLATGMTPQRPKKVDDPDYVDEYVSRPDSNIVLYNYDSRMKWIKNAALKFHQLMQDEKVYMHDELTTMAGWYNKADS
ncbi:DUF2515 family protein [Psychrobacter sp. DAB_AL43B]|uniref:DUF2515 family protein n=1 Tax=Psychrobacter sp. DAB_AL43B TaxID=1028416 RepID=UPI0009C35B82|nr:hypothetical protein [Psychrobacter sp. DAB_AL43B]SLJ84072.1 hypothetical protein DABAL43B_0873 [Psychrobacter sp. DAB_AL43B]